MLVFSIGRVEEWKKVNADHHNGQGAPDSLGTFTERIVNNGEAEFGGFDDNQRTVYW
jgi:hypothetical protein